MATRPNFIDIRSHSQGPLHGGIPIPRALPSPRLHVAGDVPPELSPLDAFAAQSRLLAKQLEESASSGNRISRLPPLTTVNSFNQPKPGFFRSASADDSGTIAPPEAQPPSGLGQRTELEVPGFRPVSVYPQMSDMSTPSPSLSFAKFQLQEEEKHRGRRLDEPAVDFGTRREQSPTPMDTQYSRGRRDNTSRSYFPTHPSVESMRQAVQGSRRDPETGAGYDSRALAPPRSPFAPKSPSVRSVSADDSDEDVASFMNASGMTGARKLSTSTAMSTSPISLFMHSVPRSPSVGSDFSAGGSHLSRPAFNFSRPLSRASETPLDIPSRQASSDSQPSFVFADDTVHTPISMHGDEFPEIGSETPAAASYVYSRFTLPRGKLLQRNSRIFQDGSPCEGYLSDEPRDQSVKTTSPPSPPSQTLALPPKQKFPSGNLDASPPPSSDHGHIRFEHSQGKPSGQGPASIASGSTVKARSQHSSAPSTEGSAEDHVTKGIECHENGSLSESTYHLRIAARQNHPTGMLLYALACRHGWGMRPNQQEGVQWLRKAADYAILEVADDNDLLKEGKSVDIVDQKTRKAQFALSIYELGVSHMNGWGIEQDKVLALRCFEIAGGLHS
jgi:hypothetical protein